MFNIAKPSGRSLFAALCAVVMPFLACTCRGTALVCSDAQCEQTATGVRLMRGDRIIWNFEIDTPEGRPFIHPMLLPSGAPLTDLRPADHVWHLGC